MSDLGHDLNPLQAANSPPTPGQLLHNARKASGLSLEQLSARVKVSVPRLLALEEDRLEVWPDPNVVRAVAAAVCRQIQIDPATVLDHMPKARQTALIVPVSEQSASFRYRSVLNLRSASGSAGWPGKLTVFAGVLVLLVLVATVFGSQWRSEFAHMVDRDGAVRPVPSAVSDAGPVLAPDAGPIDTRSAAALTAPEDSAPVISSVGSTRTDDSGLGAKERPPVVSPPTPTPAIPPKALVSFKATGETWIEVSDARGVLLLRRTLLAGDVAGASGEVPLSVVVGRADHTEVAVRGQALKLEPSPADNVAKFKVQ
jgi:cytoskeleton protein RodZ